MLLEGVVSQRLLVRKSGGGRVPAVELLLATPTIREILFEGRTRDIPAALEEGSLYGTQTFHVSLRRLLEQGAVALEEALAASDSPEALRLELRGITRGVIDREYTI